MNKVIVDTYKDRVDMVLWCQSFVGPGCPGEQVRQDYTWALKTELSQVVFTFKNTADATMFRLRWL